MKTSGVKVEIYFMGVKYVCNSLHGIPLALPEETKAKARDIVAHHIHTMAIEIKDMIESSEGKWTPDFYPVMKN